MWRTSEPALSRDSSTVFLGVLLAVMVFMATLSVLGAVLARGVVSDWEGALSGTVTVQIPPPPGLETDLAAREERREAVLRLLRVTPGLADIRIVSPEAAAELVSPWLGEGLLDRLPLPELIDVRIAGGQPVDLDALAARLDNAAPGTELDDHGRWVSDARALAASVTMVAVIVVCLVILSSILAVVFAVRTGVAVHRGEIEILALIGAPDCYIARQFEARTARAALFGGGFGSIAAGLTAAVLFAQFGAGHSGLGGLASDWNGISALFPSILATITVTSILVLVLVPAIAVLIVVLSSRLAVHRALVAAP